MTIWSCYCVEAVRERLRIGERAFRKITGLLADSLSDRRMICAAIDDGAARTTGNAHIAQAEHELDVAASTTEQAATIAHHSMQEACAAGDLYRADTPRTTPEPRPG